MPFTLAYYCLELVNKNRHRNWMFEFCPSIKLYGLMNKYKKRNTNNLYKSLGR